MRGIFIASYIPFSPQAEVLTNFQILSNLTDQHFHHRRGVSARQTNSFSATDKKRLATETLLAEIKKISQPHGAPPISEKTCASSGSRAVLEKAPSGICLRPAPLFAEENSQVGVSIRQRSVFPLLQCDAATLAAGFRRSTQFLSLSPALVAGGAPPQLTASRRRPGPRPRAALISHYSLMIELV